MGLIEWIRTMIEDMFPNMDWKQFIPSLIATFVGIVVPFLIQAKVEKRHKNSDALQRLEKIKTELSKIASQIIELNNNHVHLDPIKTPVWDGLVNTNEMLLIADLQKKKKGREENDDWYNMIYSLYGIIAEYNEWWNLYTEKLFLHNQGVTLEPILNQLKKLKIVLCFNSFEGDARKIALAELGLKEEDFKEEESIGYLLKILDERFPKKDTQDTGCKKNQRKKK